MAALTALFLTHACFHTETLLKALDSPKLASHPVVTVRAYKRAAILHFIVREGSLLAQHVRKEYADDFRFLVDQDTLAGRLPADSPLRLLLLEILGQLRLEMQEAR